jgi:uncharacterized protein YegL
MSKSLPNAFPSFVQVQSLVLNHPPVAVTPAKKPFKAKKAGTAGFYCYLILDESGSMSNLTKDTIGGVNSFLDQQRKDADGTKVTIVKFEGGNIRVPVQDADVSKLGQFTDYQPCGGTNLLDAVGHTIEMVNTMLKGKKKAERPSVFIQIVTDGHENQSRKYQREEIKNMISQCTEADWVVTYIGANVDAFAEGTSLGISAQATASYKTESTMDSYAAVAASTTRMKSLRSSGLAVSEIYSQNLAYSDDERKLMVGDKK